MSTITMAHMELNGRSWESARIEAAQMGIVLTKRKHKKGGYVCYASKKLRKKYLYETKHTKTLSRYPSGV